MGVMLHIGIDTVDMKGDGFIARIAQGNRVEAGQILVVEFDREKIAAAGFEDTTMMVVTELGSDLSLAKCPAGAVSRGDVVLSLIR